MDGEMTNCAGDYPDTQARPRFCDEANKIGKTEQCLLQQMVGMCKPQHFEPVRQRVTADEVTGCEGLATPSWKHENPTPRFRVSGCIPLMEFAECLLLMRRSALVDLMSTSVHQVIFPVEFTSLIWPDHLAMPQLELRS